MINSVIVNPTGTFGVTGGANLTYSAIGGGKFANLVATLSSPEYLTIESTVNNDSGKDSTYLLKLETFKAPPAGSPYNMPDAKLQVHAVIKGDTSVFTEDEFVRHCYRLGHILWTQSIISSVLRGDR